MTSRKLAIQCFPSAPRPWPTTPPQAFVARTSQGTKSTPSLWLYAWWRCVLRVKWGSCQARLRRDKWCIGLYSPLSNDLPRGQLLWFCDSAVLRQDASEPMCPWNSNPEFVVNEMDLEIFHWNEGRSILSFEQGQRKTKTNLLKGEREEEEEDGENWLTLWRGIECVDPGIRRLEEYKQIHLDGKSCWGSAYAPVRIWS